MKKILLVVALLIFIAFIVFWSQRTSPQKDLQNVMEKMTQEESNEPTIGKVANFTATFQISTNGTQRTFTQSMYHNQSEDVFIESSEPSTIHVEKAGTTWNDFFATLPFKLSKDCLTTGTGQTFCTGPNGKLSFFINGIEGPNALEEKINPNDNLEIKYGN